MDGMKGDYTTRNYACSCGTNVQVSHIPVRPLGDPAKYEVYCPKCKTFLGEVLYTKGDTLPHMKTV